MEFQGGATGFQGKIPGAWDGGMGGWEGPPIPRLPKCNPAYLIDSTYLGKGSALIIEGPTL